MSYPPDAALILDLIAAFRRSKTMFTAASLGVFDALTKGPQSVSSLAAELSVNAGALERLLNGCRSLGLVTLDQSGYRNAEVAEHYLVSANPDSLAGYIRYSDQSLFPLWNRLEEAVREGTNRWEQVFGSRNALFDHYFRDDQSAASFLGGMHGFGQLASNRVAQAFDLSRFTHLVDLGGATGHLAAAVCKAWPKIQATVLDLPAVEKFARPYLADSEIDFLAADFFADPLPPADLYALGRILHDWTEEKISILLRKIFSNLPAGGGLLIAETLFDDDKSGPVSTAMQDLNMLVCTEGRERTSDEYRKMLQDLGFSTIHFQKTGSLVDAILALKG